MHILVGCVFYVSLCVLCAVCMWTVQCVCVCSIMCSGMQVCVGDWSEIGTAAAGQLLINRAPHFRPLFLK